MGRRKKVYKEGIFRLSMNKRVGESCSVISNNIFPTQSLIQKHLKRGEVTIYLLQ